DLVVLLVGDDLHKAFGFVRDPRASEHAELERTDLDVVAALLRLRLREPDAADFRIAIGAAGDLVVVDRAELPAGDPLRQGHAFRRRKMRELLVARRVEG